MVVIGASGSGKSTVLRCLNLLEEPTDGKIIFDGIDINDRNVDINLHRRKIDVYKRQGEPRAPDRCSYEKVRPTG